MSDLAFRDFIERAKRISVRGELVRRGLWNEAKMSGDRGNPCPACPGTKDTFCVNTRRNLFLCHRSGAGGGAIALAMHIDGTDFVTACETVTGESRPKSGRQETPDEIRAREERYARERAAADRRRAEQQREQANYRERERQRAHELWQSALPIAGTLAEAQLRLRGLVAPPEAKLRFLPNAALWNKPANVDGARIVHQGPARVSAIQGPDNLGAGLRFAGVQLDWIDLSDAVGRARIADPERPGKLVAAKKVRGSQKGGSILWARPQPENPPEHFWLGEGTDNVGSVHNWLAHLCTSADPKTAERAPLETSAAQKHFSGGCDVAALLRASEFRAGVSLANIAGKAAGRARHPSLTYKTAAGHERPLLVPNGEPAPDDDTPLIRLGDGTSHLWLIGDGDSEPFFTRLALERGGKRYAAAYPWLTVHIVMAPAGKDFNEHWREELRRIDPKSAERFSDKVDARKGVAA